MRAHNLQNVTLHCVPNMSFVIWDASCTCSPQQKHSSQLLTEPQFRWGRDIRNCTCMHQTFWPGFSRPATENARQYQKAHTGQRAQGEVPSSGGCARSRHTGELTKFSLCHMLRHRTHRCFKKCFWFHGCNELHGTQVEPMAMSMPAKLVPNGMWKMCISFPLHDRRRRHNFRKNMFRCPTQTQHRRLN